jgi:alpha-tubulin suppressor-like RCC1 family protein
VKNRFQSLPFKRNLQRYTAHSLAVTSEGAVYSWGVSKEGVLGYGGALQVGIKLTHNP